MKWSSKKKKKKPLGYYNNLLMSKSSRNGFHDRDNISFMGEVGDPK